MIFPECGPFTIYRNGYCEERMRGILALRKFILVTDYERSVSRCWPIFESSRRSSSA